MPGTNGFLPTVWLFSLCFLANSFLNTRKLQNTGRPEPNTAEVVASSNSQSEVELKCSPWEINIDSWWQMHPDWEPFGENETHTCFRPIQNPENAQFLRDLYKTQYHGRPCSDASTKNIRGTGFAASIGAHASGFWSAFRVGYPFQVKRHWEGFRWMYVPEDPDSWAHCPASDHTCYFLPISNCAITYSKEESRTKKYLLNELRNNATQLQQYSWMEAYLLRPHQHVRQKLRQLMEQEAPSMDGNCTWIHVRRGDAQTEQIHPRNFHAVGEYLEAGNIASGSTVLLLTDDATALEEAQWLHPQYQWVYWNRTRNRGPSQKNSHFPSNDVARELLIILAEIELAGQCAKGVHGTSNMVSMFHHSMIRQQGIQNIQLVPLPKEGEKVKPNVFMNEIEAKLEKAKITETVIPK